MCYLNLYGRLSRPAILSNVWNLTLDSISWNFSFEEVIVCPTFTSRKLLGDSQFLEFRPWTTFYGESKV